MTTITREFYQSWRGPAPADQDSWYLVFDEATRRLTGAPRMAGREAQRLR